MNWIESSKNYEIDRFKKQIIERGNLYEHQPFNTRKGLSSEDLKYFFDEFINKNYYSEYLNFFMFDECCYKYTPNERYNIAEQEASGRSNKTLEGLINELEILLQNKEKIYLYDVISDSKFYYVYFYRTDRIYIL